MGGREGGGEEKEGGVKKKEERLLIPSLVEMITAVTQRGYKQQLLHIGL